LRKAPAFQFYPGDWMRDLSLRSCTVTSRGMWIDLLCLMWDGEPRGFLRVGGRAIGAKEISRLLGVKLSVVESSLADLKAHGVSSAAEDGALYSRRMVRDERVREVRASGGPKGAEFGPQGAEYGAKGGRPKTPLNGDGKGGFDIPPSCSAEKPPPASASASASGSVVLSSPAGPLNGSGNSTSSPGGLSPAVLAKVDESNFDAFWDAYPKKVGKLNARKAWKQTTKLRPALAVLLDRLRILSASPQWTKDGAQYAPHPATWLRRGGWDDEPEGTNAQPRASSRIDVQAPPDDAERRRRRMLANVG